MEKTIEEKRLLHQLKPSFDDWETWEIGLVVYIVVSEIITV